MRPLANFWANGSWRLTLGFLSAFFLLNLPPYAQTPPASDTTISTDRPAVSESSVVVPQGGFQLENGMLFTNTSGNYILDLPESNFRYGLLNKTELRFSIPDYFQNLSPGSAAPSGFGDLALGVKQQLGPFHNLDLSAILFLCFPTGSSAISSHGYDPGLQIPWTYKLSANWTAGGQVAFYWPTVTREHNFTPETAFFLDRQLTKPWDAFVEYAGDLPERGGSRNQLHFGTAYKLTPRQQLDFHVSFGLSNAAPHTYMGFGYSFLFLPK